MPRHHLAQFNIARLRAPLDSPLLADFVARLDEVNAIAEAAPGFVWRFKTEDGNATAVRPYDDDRIVINFSIWESPDMLKQFAYRAAHAELLRRRLEWFEHMQEDYLVMWWIPEGARPTVEEAVARLAQLRAMGPTPEAFTFRKLFPPPAAQQEPELDLAAGTSAG